jgi:hypothetical protein
MVRWGLVAVLTALGLSFTAGGVAAQQAEVWRLSPQWTLDGPSPGSSFGSINGVTITPSGRLFVLDAMNGRVSVVDAPSGTPIHGFSRLGQGPGELSQTLAGITTLGDGSIAVNDLGSRRVVIWAEDGESTGGWPLSNGIPANLGSITMRIAGSRGGLIKEVHPLPLVPGLSPKDTLEWPTLLRVTPSGNVEDTLHVFRDAEQPITMQGPTVATALYPPTPTWAASDALLLVGLTNSYSITMISLDDRHGSRVISRDVEARRLSAGEKRRLTERTLRAVPEGAPDITVVVPDMLPVIGSILIDSEYGRIYVARHIGLIDESSPEGRFSLTDEPGGQEAQMWDVFSRDGRYLAVLYAPPRFNLLAVLGDRFFGKALGEFGEPTLVALGLERSR